MTQSKSKRCHPPPTETRRLVVIIKLYIIILLKIKNFNSLIGQTYARRERATDCGSVQRPEVEVNECACRPVKGGGVSAKTIVEFIFEDTRAKASADEDFNVYCCSFPWRWDCTKTGETFAFLGLEV